LHLPVYGTKRIGPDNPSHFRRLERHLQVARKSKDEQRIRNAEFDLQSLPIRYSFAQEVRLYQEEASQERSEVGEPTGRHLAPHWRRGHYRMQAYGPGLSQRRRIAVPAVLVNGHLFLNDPSQTSTRYHS
jgi:hypothetical protein